MRLAACGRRMVTPRSSSSSTAVAVPIVSAARRAARARRAGLRPNLMDAVEVAHQLRAGLAQARRKHGDELDQDLRAELRALEDDLRHVVAREHAEGRGLGGAARRKARL